jgi:hypothetical protein
MQSKAKYAGLHCFGVELYKVDKEYGVSLNCDIVARGMAKLSSKKIEVTLQLASVNNILSASLFTAHLLCEC